MMLGEQVEKFLVIPMAHSRQLLPRGSTHPGQTARAGRAAPQGLPGQACTAPRKEKQTEA